MIADSQVHIWAADSPERPWPTGVQVPPQRPVPLGADELLTAMDEAGVDRVVLVPPSWEGDRNDLVIDAATRFPDRFCAMARVNAHASPQIPLSHWKEQPGIKGVRVMFLLPDQRAWMTDGSAEWVYSQAEQLDLPLMIFAPDQTPAIGEIARRHPGLRVIVDHLNLGLTVRNAEIAPTVAPLLELASLSNVAVKVSALPCHVDEGYPFPTVDAVVEQVIRAFGAERCMWGSDYSRLPVPYGDWVRFGTEAATFLSEKERELLMGGALASWLDWPAPS